MSGSSTWHGQPAAPGERPGGQYRPSATGAKSSSSSNKQRVHAGSASHYLTVSRHPPSPAAPPVARPAHAPYTSTFSTVSTSTTHPSYYHHPTPPTLHTTPPTQRDTAPPIHQESDASCVKVVAREGPTNTPSSNTAQPRRGEEGRGGNCAALAGRFQHQVPCSI